MKQVLAGAFMLATMLAASPVGAQCRLSLDALRRTVPSSPSGSPVLADLDADGIQDLVVADVGVIESWRGTGDGWFELVASATSTVSSHRLVTGDVDADGDADVLALDIGLLEAFLGDGDGGLQPLPASPSPVDPIAVVADMNLDGAADLVTWDEGNNELRVLLGNGDGTFQAASYAVSAVGIPAVADLNGDGPPDVVIPLAGGMGILMGNPDGTLDPLVAHASGTYVMATTGDVDGSGSMDVLAHDSGVIAVLLGPGNGTLGAPIVTPFPGSSIEGLAAGDLDGDGDADVVIVTDDGLCQIRSRGDGTFEAPLCERHSLDVSPGHPMLQVIVDVDGDGHLDAAFGQADAGAIIALGRGDGSVKDVVRTPLGADPGSLATGDLDLDGIDDVVTIESGSISVYLGTPSGSLAGMPPVAGGGEDVAIADLDGDGWSDLVTGEVETYRGAGDGTFTFWQAGPFPGRHTAVGDVDGNGTPDILADANVILVGRDGSLGPAAPLPVESRVVADLDGDGFLDAVGLGYWAPGNGDGTFQPGGWYATLHDPTDVAVADLDGDGAPDLLVTLGSDDGLAIVINGGGGTFQPPVVYPVSGHPARVTTTDLDGDGQLDVLVAGNWQAWATDPPAPRAKGPSLLHDPPRMTTILRGDGTGRLEPEGAVDVGWPMAVAVLDLDRDGAPDPVFADATSLSPSVAVAFNSGIGIEPADLPPGITGAPYAASLAANGGTAPYAFALATGSLPPGVALSPGGQLSGTPAQPGVHRFAIEATDARGCRRRAERQIRVASAACAEDTISPPTLWQGYVGGPFAATLTSSGPAPHAFSIVAGGLPPGLALSPGGVVSGIPVLHGSFPFEIAVVDAGGCVGHRRYVQRVVTCPGLSLAPATLPGGQVGATYLQTLAAAGGVAPYSFSIATGTLPPGLVLSVSGTISGTLAAPGSFAFDVRAADANGCAVVASYVVAVSCPTMGVLPATLPGGRVGTPYLQSLTAIGGAGPYTFAVASGALPAGLALSTTGVISGTPTATGASAFAVAVVDSTGCGASRGYSIDVARPASAIVAGQGLGAPNPNQVRTFDPGGNPTGVDFMAYGAGAFGVNVVTGDIDGDAYAEILTGPGPGPSLGPQVRGFRRDGAAMGKVSFYAYGTLRFGVNVAGGDIDPDAFDEILTGGGPGAVFGPHVRAFDVDGGAVIPKPGVSFFAFGTPRHGVNVGAGDVDGDGHAEILAGPGPSAAFASTVRGFDHDGQGVLAIASLNFNAFAALRHGARVAGGDADGDGFAELAVAPGPGPTNPSRILGFDHDGILVAPLPGYDVVPFGSLYGARVGQAETVGGAPQELLCGPGTDPSAAAEVREYAYDGAGLQALGGTPFTAFPSGYGVDVTAGPLL